MNSIENTCSSYCVVTRSVNQATKIAKLIVTDTRSAADLKSSKVVGIRSNFLRVVFVFFLTILLLYRFWLYFVNCEAGWLADSHKS